MQKAAKLRVRWRLGKLPILSCLVSEIVMPAMVMAFGFLPSSLSQKDAPATGVWPGPEAA